ADRCGPSCSLRAFACERLPSRLRDLHANDLHRASARAHVLGLRRCEPSEAQIDQQLDAKAVRQHQRFGHAFRCAGEHTNRTTAVTALALRTRWHRAIGPNYDTLIWRLGQVGRLRWMIPLP